jgi:hypothetical protein
MRLVFLSARQRSTNPPFNAEMENRYHAVDDKQPPQGAAANTLKLQRNRNVGFVDWLGLIGVLI